MRFRSWLVPRGSCLAVLVLPLVVALFCPVRSHAQSASDDVAGLSVPQEISAKWNAFTNRGASVYDVLDNLGVVDFTDMTGSRFTVLWNGTPTIFLDGEFLENLEVVRGEQNIQVTSFLFGPPEQILRTMFRLNNRGGLVIETSDGDGFNGSQFVFNDSGGLVKRAHCRCVRNVLTPAAVPCTVAQCNDPGTTCGAATFFCKWMGAPPLAKSDM